MQVETPERVLRLQQAISATSRMLIMRLLLVDGPMTFDELHRRLPGLSQTALRIALVELAEGGYVSDDSPAGRQRKSKLARFSIDREAVLRDISELFMYMAG